MTDRPQESRVKIIAGVALVAILAAFTTLYIRGRASEDDARDRAESSPASQVSQGAPADR